MSLFTQCFAAHRLFNVSNNISYYRLLRLNNIVNSYMDEQYGQKKSTQPQISAKNLWIVWKDTAKWPKTLKVKIRGKKYKRCLIISKENPQRLFVLFVSCLVTSALCPTIPPNNPCMLCVQELGNG